MSRRGGRRQVLQLGESSSKLHRYGYSKGFQSSDSSVQSSLVTGLVGDYSDSDSDSNSNNDQMAVSEPTGKTDEPNDITPPPSVVQDSVTIVKKDVKEDPMDDELRNFLSEIEAIPVPDESKTPDRLSEGVPSPAPTNQTSVPGTEKYQEDPVVEESSSSNTTARKKMSGAYSMFVKGDVEFAHSPSPTPPAVTEPAGEQQDKIKPPTDNAVADMDFSHIPEEPKTCWQMVQDETTQYYYYWNWQTNQVTWEIPTDYTQYLLLHKEYKEKLAKIPPHVLQAWKDSNAGTEKATNERNSGGHSTVMKDSLSTALTTTSAKIHSEGKEEEDKDRHSHHQHKRKKSKKHKRRRNSSSDEDLDEKYLRGSEDNPSLDSSSKSKKSKPAIGPQPLSIVPYMSDDNEEDSDNDAIAKNENTETNLTSNTESRETVAKSKDGDGSKSPSPASLSEECGDAQVTAKKTDFESLVQNLVEFHDKMTLPGKHGDIGSINDVASEVKETNLDGVEIKGETNQNSDEVGLTNSVPDKLMKGESGQVQGSDVKKESDATNDSGAPEEADTSTSFTKEKERQNIFDQFSVIKEKKEKRKKKAINMFADDSQSEIEENGDGNDGNAKDNSKVQPDTVLKQEVEEGELSDSSESLTRNIAVSKSTHLKKGKEIGSTVTLTTDMHGPEKQQTSLIRGIVGYSEEDEEEEEEGELKDEDTAKDGEKTISETVIEPKKRVLQYKDYMKKYRSGDKATAADNNVVNNQDTSVKVKDLNQSPSSTPSQSHDSVKSSAINVTREEEKTTIQQVAMNMEAVEDSVNEKEEEEVLEKAEVDDDDDLEDDLDLDDLDNIDRVLEKALEKKREQKTESKQETVEKTGDAPETSHTSPTSPSSTTGTKKTDELDAQESSLDGSAMSETDMKRLKYAVKDSAELALHKLQFLDISTKNLSKLQVLLVELQTRYNDWQSGGLSTPYFHKQLKSSEALLSQYEESAVPAGWSCQWDRASFRYFYRNEQDGHTQWEYPQVGPSSSTSTAPMSSSSKVKGGGEVKDSGGGSSSRGRSGKKRRSKDVEEREESSSKSRGHNSSSRSSRSHRSNKKATTEKDRGKRDRHTSSSSHHHRKKKRRRRDNSGSSSSSEGESTQSRHRHRGKRKKRSRSDKSPSLELIDYEGPERVQVIEDSPPPSVRKEDASENRTGSDGGGRIDSMSHPLGSTTLGLIADYGSDQDMDEEEKDEVSVGGEQIQNSDGKPELDSNHCPAISENGVGEEESKSGNRNKTSSENEMEGIDGVEMRKEVREDGKEEEEEKGEAVDNEEEEVNSAVIVKPPQIIVPPYVAAMNQPQLYSAPALYASAPAPSATTTMMAAVLPEHSKQEHEQGDMTAISQTTEEADKAIKKKKKDKSGKEKSLSANSSIMMKKKRVSSMVQKWQQVKKEVEKENRDKELRQAAIREKINQLKST